MLTLCVNLSTIPDRVSEVRSSDAIFNIHIGKDVTHSVYRMSLIDVNLRVPSSRASCAAWLLIQDPETVAEALSLCEAALGAVRRDVSEGESAKLRQVHHLQVQVLQDQLDQEKDRRQEALREAKKRSDDAVSAIERRHKDSMDALMQQLQSSQEAYNQLQWSITDQRETWQKDLNLHVKKLEETHDKKASLLQKKLEELDEQLVETRVSKQRLADETAAVITRRLEQDHERRETQLLAEIDSLKRDAELKKGSEAQSLLEEKRRGEELLRQKESEHQRILEQNKEDRLKYETFLTSALEKRSAELAEAQASKDAAAQRVETLVSEHRELVARLGGSSARGQMGERFVANIFARLQLGDWQDEHGVQEEGYADALWTWQASPTTPVLSCIVEVKYTSALHSQHDIAKFHRDIQTAANNNRANAGLFISLAKHYTGKPSLQLTVEHGMPILYASRDEDDALPAASLVQLAFQAMATAWPLICRQRGEGVELTVRAAADQFEEQLSRCTSLSKHIGSITRSATSMLREAKALEKLRDSMIKGIEGVRMNHPSLVPELPELEESEEADEARPVDPWSSPGAQQFLAAIFAAKKGARYPKEGDVTFEGEAACFMQAMPNAFVLALDRLKKEASKGRKRKAESGVEADADE